MQLSLLLLLPFASVVLSHSVNDTLLWGVYRPNLYFGLRPRIPQSLMTGLLWFGTQDYQSVGSGYTLLPIVPSTMIELAWTRNPTCL